MGLRRIAAHVSALGLFLGILTAPSSAEGVFDVAAENAKPGSRGWTIAKQQFTLKTLAFADRVSVLPGESFGLYVECAASTFTVRAYRIGDYAGAGARRVWSSEETPCERQPAATFESSTNTEIGRAHV